MKPIKILSFDAETDGLWGEVFAIGAVVYEWKEVCPMVVKDTNGKINTFEGRRWGVPSENRNEWPTDPGPWHVWVQDGPLEWRWMRVAQFSARNLAHKVQNEWVRENVEPGLYLLDGYDDHTSMIEAFSKFYFKHKSVAKMLTHMGYIVEAHLLREMHRLGYISEWDGPYSEMFAPWHDVSQDLESAGYDPSSVDAYAKKNDVMIQVFGRGHQLRFIDECKAHNPVDDAEIAARVWMHILQIKNNE